MSGLRLITQFIVIVSFMYSLARVLISFGVFMVTIMDWRVYNELGYYRLSVIATHLPVLIVSSLILIYVM